MHKEISSATKAFIATWLALVAPFVLAFAMMELAFASRIGLLILFAVFGVGLFGYAVMEQRKRKIAWIDIFKRFARQTFAVGFWFLAISVVQWLM